MNGQWEQFKPAMAVDLTDHVWSLTEWLQFPAVQREQGARRDEEGR